MLINVNDPTRIPIKYMWQLIYTFTFDKKSTGHMTKDIIGKQIVKWMEFVEINKKRECELYGLDPNLNKISLGLKGSVLDEMEYQVVLMADWVVKEEQGFFIKKVEDFKKHNIDFRLTPGICDAFPEYCRQHRNYAKGQVALEQAMKDHPEDYDGKKYYFGRDQ